MTERTSHVSASEPDWEREMSIGRSWDPGRTLLRSIRKYQSATGPFADLRRKLAIVQHRFWSAVSGADIPLNASISGGLLIPHPNGIVVHPDAVIGCNCLIFQQVTIGATAHGVPKIGGHVDIGAGAKIIGPVTIGDHARIGANAVVRVDVPAHSTFVAPEGYLLEARLAD